MAAVKQYKSLLEKSLSVFSEVKAGEGISALLLFGNLFTLLTSYYIMKTIREALILAGSGAEVKSYSSAGQALLLLLAVPLYGALANKFPRRKLINVVTLFFTACLGFFFVLAQMKVPLGVIFYLWVGIFNMMIVAQFWAFANDLYTPETGKRLFVIVAFGASSGAVFGSFLAGRLIGPFDVNQLFLVSGAILAFSLLFTNLVDARERRRGLEKVSSAQQEEIEEPMGKEGAFKLVFRNRYLLMIALLLMVLNWVNTTGEYILGKTIARAASEAVASGASDGLTTGQFIGKFYADFFTIVNIMGLVLQLFIVSRVLKYLGVRIAILVLPLLAFGGYLIMAFLPVLAAVRWAKILENSTDYSLQNTVRHILFLPTTREEKYKAKQAIDSFFVRAGDVLSAVLVYVGTTIVTLSIAQFALVNLALVLLWIFLAIRIGQKYRKMTAQNEANGQLK